MLKRVAADGGKLTPRWAPGETAGFSYWPGLDRATREIFDRDLAYLADRDYLAREHFDKMTRCPSCSSHTVNVREVCVSCKSTNLASQPMLHHYRCGYVGAIGSFETEGDARVCPKCDGYLRNVGTDHEVVGEQFSCRRCFASFEEPDVEGHCLNCGTHTLADKLLFDDIFEYHLTNLGHAAVRSGRLFDREDEQMTEPDLPLYRRNVAMQLLREEVRRQARYKISFSALLVRIKGPGAASGKPQPPPLFVVEGRIGGRWWVWQRFRVRDEGARELAALASQRRFDGVRLIQTVPGGQGVSTTARELVVVDQNGVHAPGMAAEEHDFKAPAPVERAAAKPAAARRRQRQQQPAAQPPKPESSQQMPTPILADGALGRDGNGADDGAAAQSGDFRIEPVVVEAGPGDDAAFDDAAGYPPTHEMARRLKRRQIAYTLGAGVASLLLAVVSYEITRSAIGMPDLLFEARQSLSAMFAGPERPIVTAARQGNTEEVAKLLRGGFSPNTEDAYGVPALVIASRAGKSSVVRQLLEAGADPNRPFRRDDTPMLAAAREGLNAALEQMLAKGGHVNGRGGADFCETPLLVAAAGGRMDTVSFLLSKGAAFDVLPGCRRGPIDAAAAYPRVREALEQAYQRRLAAARTGQSAPAAAVLPAAAQTQAQPPVQAPVLPAPPAPSQARPAQPLPPAPAKPAQANPVQADPAKAAPAAKPAAQAKPQPAAMSTAAPDMPGLEAAYRPIMFGFTWNAGLAEVRAKSKACRDVGKRYLACELAVKPWLDDIERVEAWFDRSDGERLVAIEALSAVIVDVSANLDGINARQRFDKARAAIEKRLPADLRPIVARQAPVGVPFFGGLKPEVNAGDFSAFWSDDGKRRPAAIHLKLTGVDDQSGYLRIVVSNPNRYSQQAQVDQPKR
jgi:hypothetical protein